MLGLFLYRDYMRMQRVGTQCELAHQLRDCCVMSPKWRPPGSLFTFCLVLSKPAAEISRNKIILRLVMHGHDFIS